MKLLILLLSFVGLVTMGCSDKRDDINDNIPTKKPDDGVQKPDNDQESPLFVIDPDGCYIVKSEGGEVLLNVTTNIEYSLYIPQEASSWLSYQETRATRTETVVLSVAANTDLELRAATIELRGADDTTIEKFTIIQSPFVPNDIEDDEPDEKEPIFVCDAEECYTVVAEGGDVTVTVATDIEYTVDIPQEAQSWIYISDTRSVRLEKVVLTVAMNDAIVERSADIRLLGVDDQVLCNFTITQDAKIITSCANNEIIYTTQDGYSIDLRTTEGFGGNYVSHTFEGGYGRITFDDDVVTIPLIAFRDCTTITSIYLPRCVTVIARGAFYNCSALESITIPAGVTTIGEWAFDECNLEYVAIDNLSHWCNITFADDQANPLFYAKELYIDGEAITEITIPEDITTINSYAFRGWKSLKRLIIPDHVTTIKKYAFSVCDNLSHITIGSGVTTMESRSFYGCTGELNINSDIPNASDYNKGPFYNAKFGKITIGDSVSTIGDHAFRSCDTCADITLGKGVVTIGDSAFYGWSALTNITIPDSVASIGDGAFYDNTALTSVTIGKGVTSIGKRAFYGCTSLRDVYCMPLIPPAASSYMFDSNASMRKIYVPADSVDEYRAASYWSGYADSIEGYTF